MPAISTGCLRKFGLFLSTGIVRGRTGRKFGFTRSGDKEYRRTKMIARRKPESCFSENEEHCEAFGSGLLNALFLGVPADQRIEDRQDVSPVFDHAIEDVAEFGVALGVAVPLQQDGLGHFDITAELLGRMAAQEQTIEKRRFPLRKGEVCGDFCRNDLCDRGHEKNAVYRKASPRQVVQVARCGLADKASTELLARRHFAGIE